MAERKSFVLHLDSLCILDKMSNEQAGALIKIIYKYQIEGSLPEMDFAIDMAVTPFINQFKRDNEKYEAIVERNRDNGKLGGRPKIETQQNPTEPTGLFKNPKNPTEPTGLFKNPKNPTEPKKADSDNDSDNDSDSGIIHIAATPPFSFFSELIAMGVDRDLANDWIKVRKTRKATNTKTALDAFKKEVDKTGRTASEVVRKCVTESWAGFKASWALQADTYKKPIEGNNDHTRYHTLSDGTKISMADFKAINNI